MNVWIAASLSLLAMTACAGASPPTQAGPASAGVAFDLKGERGAWAEGLADPSTGRAATPDDPARIASVSKLVVAIGVMKLAEQGRLDLDRDVSSYLGWYLRNPAFPTRPITLRQLLSHTSSIRDGDDAYVVPLGASLQEALAETQVWDLAHGPDEHYFAYSNFNFPVIGSIVERVTGERFDQWMRRELLAPMKLDACFNWPTCSDAAVTRAVVLTQDGTPVRDDLHGRRPDCPVFVDKGPCDLGRWKLGENGGLFSPQGGLRISARGLERVGRLLLNKGELDGVRILSPQSVETMLAPAWQFDGKNGSREGESDGICSYGFAAIQLVAGDSCNIFPEASAHAWVGHSGDAYGLRSGIWIDRKAGIGIGYFVTGLADDTPHGKGSFSVTEEEAFRRSVAHAHFQ
ncbi:serine hydrolase [Sphingomonas sp.]|uniref:serine hydrolase domain-containing protein n=1 Tax=Sphingomonas sp. TaxID=28214 RepID=UPI0025E0385C|nr:serine hydrolase [Sphingomonas sp.]